MNSIEIQFNKLTYLKFRINNTLYKELQVIAILKNNIKLKIVKFQIKFLKIKTNIYL